MEKQKKELLDCFKNTAQEALKRCYGFAPTRLSEIEILDENSRADFKFKVGEHEYRFNSFSVEHNTISPDGLNIWIGKDSVTKL